MSLHAKEHILLTLRRTHSACARKKAVGVPLWPQEIWTPEELHFCSSWSLGSCSWDLQNYKDELPEGSEGQAEHVCWLPSHFLVLLCELLSHSGTASAEKILNVSHWAQLRAFCLEIRPGDKEESQAVTCQGSVLLLYRRDFFLLLTTVQRNTHPVSACGGSTVGFWSYPKVRI